MSHGDIQDYISMIHWFSFSGQHFNRHACLSCGCLHYEVLNWKLPMVLQSNLVSAVILSFFNFHLYCYFCGSASGIVYKVKCPRRLYSYTSAPLGNFLSPISVSDWLIFCCENSMLYQKRNENDTNTNILMKKKKKKENICKYNVAFFVVNSPPWWNMLQTLEIRRK